MDLTSILQFAGFVFGLLTVAGTLYWRVQVMIKEVRDESAIYVKEVRDEATKRAEAALIVAHAAARELLDYKVHSAETFVSKQGLREVEDRIMDALGVLGSQITSLSGRVDRVIERPSTASTRAKTV